MKTPRGVEALICDLSRGTLWEVALAMLNGCSSQDFARGIGVFKRLGPSAAVLEKHDKVVMGALWRMAYSLVGNILTTSEQFNVPPYSFVGLLSKDETRRRVQCLDGLRNAWDALQKLEATALVDDDARYFYHNVVPAQQQFVREVFVELVENDFTKVPGNIHSLLQNFVQSWHTTLPIEEFFNAGRRLADLNRAKRLDPEALYHTCVFGCPMLEEFGRRGLRITAAARSVAPAKLPASVFGIEHEGEVHHHPGRPRPSHQPIA